MSEADITAPTTLGPGRVPGGMPLKIHLDEPAYAALVRIAQDRRTTAARMVEDLVLHALSRAAAPPPAAGPITRPHTTYDDATQGFRRD